MTPRKAMAFSERWCQRDWRHVIWLAPLAVLYGAFLFFMVLGEMMASALRGEGMWLK